MTISALLSSFSEAKRANDPRAAAEYLRSALEQQRSTGEAVPRSSWYDLAALLFGLGQLADAERWARAGLERLPNEANLHNVLAITLKNTGRLEEAERLLLQAIRLDPKLEAARVNLGNVYLALNNGPKAVEIFSKLAKAQPNKAEFQRLLGVGHRMAGELEQSRMRFERARRLSPRDLNLWVDITAVVEDLGQHEQAVETIEKAIEEFGPVRLLVETRIKLFRRAGRHTDAIAWIEGLIEKGQAEAWLYADLARTVSHTDRVRANVLYKEALDRAPDDPVIMTAWADNLDRTRGKDEAANIAAGYDLARRRLALGGDLRRDARVMRKIFVRAADYDALESFGTFENLGRYFATSGQEAALHYMMSQVTTSQQRRDLLSFHRMWGERSVALAALKPVKRPPPVTGRAKIRVGFMSSDLRNHPVAYFVAPLLQNYDRKTFEFYCYSWCTHPPDPIEQAIAKSVDMFRKHGSISEQAAAQLIADDALDILFDLGGSTDMNKIEVMGYRAAQRQASWLGYPHSAGLATIDRILVDPFIMPEDPSLLIEQPFRLTRSWVALHKPGFGPIPPVTPTTPEERNGFVTFGTMNGTYKYNAGLFETWADILKRVPRSQFLFVRPESAVSSFRDNVAALFEKHGVSADRIRHVGVRGGHMPYYNDIDVALDTFPQTGGTTTCETLWMGVPCVTLVGEAFFERLSYSNLENAGLGELCTFDRQAYIDKAVETAGRTEWRAELRRTMPARLRDYPLGRPDLFIEDFQETLQAWMDEPRP
jgi:predicted O-linked N-acetylglucosamine transferase (SPINDLY family)